MDPQHWNKKFKNNKENSHTIHFFVNRKIVFFCSYRHLGIVFFDKNAKK
jgi:hypothetical protein